MRRNSSLNSRSVMSTSLENTTSALSGNEPLSKPKRKLSYSNMCIGANAGIGTYPARRKSSRSSTAGSTDSRDSDLLLEKLYSGSRKWSAVSLSMPALACGIGTSVREYQEDEYLYRLLLRSIVSPLGAPDIREGFRPTELASVLRQIFGISEEEHEKWLKEEMHNKPANVHLNVKVIEARNLKAMDSNGLSDPYCLLSVATPRSLRRGSPKTSAKGGHKSSPHPKEKFRHVSFDMEVRQTQTIKGTLNPKWNEEFDMDVRDIDREELHVYVWDNDEDSSVMDSLKQLTLDKPSGLKSLFRTIKQTVEYGRPVDDFIGMAAIPISDIQAAGDDAWFDLFEYKKGSKQKSSGQIHLKLELSVKQNLEQNDIVESEQCSIDDFYHIVQQMYRYTHKPDQEGGATAILSHLCEQSQHILSQFAVQHHISKLTQAIIELVVILESVSQDGCYASNELIIEAIAKTENNWLTSKSSGASQSTITDAEFSLLDKAANSYVTYVLDRTTNLPPLFPPNLTTLQVLQERIGILTMLWSMNKQFWSNSSTSKRDLTSLCITSIQTDVKNWTSVTLKSLEDFGSVKDNVIPETLSLVDIVKEAAKACTAAPDFVQFFNKLDVDYYKIVSITLEGKLSIRAQEVMQRMVRYQIRYQKHHANIQQSSSVSLQLYFALRDFLAVAKRNVSDRELFKLTVANYQKWFEESLCFWLQTFKDECIRRMEKALEIDKDVVQATTLVKCSHSLVDVKSCFAKMTTEWNDIGFKNPDHALLGVTKITDTICDGARLYVEKIATILERRSYYDENDNNLFDVTDQCCITLNNIENVRLYLGELPSLLRWEEVAASMATKHEDDYLAEKVLKTLIELTSNADNDILIMSSKIIEDIVEKMVVDLTYFLERVVQVEAENRSAMDPLMEYLETNLKTVYSSLEESICPRIIHRLWESVLDILNAKLLSGKPPEYYRQIKVHLKVLRSYFIRGGADEVKVDSCDCSNLKKKLERYSVSTEDLIFACYKDLCKHVETPVDYYGHLAVKLGYAEDENDDFVTLSVQVINGTDFPGVFKNGKSNPYVSASPCPKFLFPSAKTQKTQIVMDTNSPVFNETLYIKGVPVEHMEKDGAVLVITVWNYDCILPNEFLGEIVMPLTAFGKINKVHTIDFIPSVMMPLRRPPEPRHGAYQILKERSECMDKQASIFMQRRSIMAGYRVNKSYCKGLTFLFKKFQYRQEPKPASKNVTGFFESL